jgi:hypothetical protein
VHLTPRGFPWILIDDSYHEMSDLSSTTILPRQPQAYWNASFEDTREVHVILLGSAPVMVPDTSVLVTLKTVILYPLQFNLQDEGTVGQLRANDYDHKKVKTTVCI